MARHIPIIKQCVAPVKDVFLDTKTACTALTSQACLILTILILTYLIKPKPIICFEPCKM
jgi:hypothetical protein